MVDGRIIIGSINGLASDGRQAINGINDDLRAICW